MNYIVLEGISLYIFLVVTFFLLVTAVVSLICAMVSDRHRFCLETVIDRKNNEIGYLVRENLVLKIKCGDLEIDD